MAQNELILDTVDFSQAGYDTVLDDNFTAIKTHLESRPLAIHDIDGDGTGDHPSAAAFPHSLYFFGYAGHWDLWFTENATGENYKCARAHNVVDVVTTTSADPYDLVLEETQRYFINTGATAETWINLPSASTNPANGFMEFFFIVDDADGIQINAIGGDTIQLGSSTGGSIASTTVGDVLHVLAISSTQWIAIPIAGSGWALGT